MLLSLSFCGVAHAARAPVAAQRQMVVAGHPLASAAGREVLRAGGSAVDAAIAAALVLGVVEPQESGIGGGGIMLVAEPGTSATLAYDGREAAPAAADPWMFVDKATGTVRAEVTGGIAVAVPGQLRMMELAHRRHGKLPWADLFVPAIRIAGGGFALSNRVAALARAESADIRRFGTAAAYFLSPSEGARTAGAPMRNPALAETLRAIAAGGAATFYTGPLARDLAAAVGRSEVNPGRLTPEDLAGYTARAGVALCGSYRGSQVCGPPPPAAGLLVLQALAMLEPQALSRLEPNEAAAIHLMSEAMRLAAADNMAYLRDPAFGPVPVRGLLDRRYLAERGALIRPDRAGGRFGPGSPPRGSGAVIDPALPAEGPTTTHITVVDAAGGVVSFTTTLGHYFGSHVMVRGFLLNDAMNAFSRRPEVGGSKLVNAIEPGKRPRTSMAPVIVRDAAGTVTYSTGSPGATRIPSYVLKALVARLDWNLDPQAAADLPNHAADESRIELERGTALERLAPQLEAMGHGTRISILPSGLNGIAVSPGRLLGGADLRREGLPMGD
jgi:gamma-glutamyltranspeptidase/glutathione hydrolase